jgi:hypothetical protein
MDEALADTCPSRKPEPFEILDIFSLCSHPSVGCLPCDAMMMRFLMMPPIVSALLALLVSLFQSRWAMHLQILALQHQVAVYKQTVHRPRLRTTDRVATTTVSRPLAAVEPEREAWSAGSRAGGACADPGYVASKPDLGFPSHYG